MPKTFTVRLAIPEDEAAVSVLLQASYSSLMARAYDAQFLAKALDRMTQANPALLASGSYYVAESPEQMLVGCGGWTVERPGSGEVETGLAHIRHFATHPEWVRRGVGRTIYTRCETEARRMGIQWFECYASLNAEAFYAALGFQFISDIDVPMGGNLELPAVLMQRRL